MTDRATIAAKTHNRCAYCRKPLPRLLYSELEHKTPKAQGGSNRASNRVLACIQCNRLKGNRTVGEFRAYYRMQIDAAIEQVRRAFSAAPFGLTREAGAEVDECLRRLRELGAEGVGFAFEGVLGEDGEQ